MPAEDGKEPRAASELEAIQKRIEVLEEVLGASTDPIFHILEDGTYRYVNLAFSSHFDRTPEEVAGRRIYDIFPADEADKRMTVVRRAFATGETIVFEVRVPMAREEDRYFITSVRPIRGTDGKVASVVCISKDITDRKRVEVEREKLIEELQAALAHVRTLSGLLPICASCKKIRDDQGYWRQIESYIRDHSEAEFSHGVCPECAKHLYPEAAAQEPKHA
jgi:PAS domain S-box-containing protein